MMEQQAVTDAVLKLGESGFKGELIQPGDGAYDEARAVYNGMIDKRPALIVRPTGAADVIDAVNLAREKSLPLAVRCGGPRIAGKSAVDDGLMGSGARPVGEEGKSRWAPAYLKKKPMHHHTPQAIVYPR